MRNSLIFATAWVMAASAWAAKIEVYFSPSGGAQAAVIAHIERAKKEIVVAAYSFTDPAVGAALLTALKRGIPVAIVLDKDHNRRGEKKSNETPAVADMLEASGAVVYIAPKGIAIQHNKFIVVDGLHVQMGSYNYSKAAEKSNAENILILTDVPNLATEYKKAWALLRDKSAVFKARY
jgi:phosphatidylserine/phosphatidylglycerophosphate/cardiolipin synthase-like enzyme